MNEQNLIPANKRTKDEVREITRKGGIASGEARRKKKTLRELAELIGSNKTLNEKAIKALSEDFGLNEEDITHDAVVLARQYQKAENGDVKSARFIADIKGEMKQSVELTGKDGKDLFSQNIIIHEDIPKCTK